MAGYHDIIGHEKIKEHLQKAIGYQRVSHAYILSGEEGMGRKTIAKAFAMTLLCEKHGTEPCMVCHSCKQFLSGNHPDVSWVTHEKPASIGVDDVRIQINDTVSIRPYSSPYKIYLVDEAEKMTVGQIMVVWGICLVLVAVLLAVVGSVLLHKKKKMVLLEIEHEYR